MDRERLIVYIDENTDDGMMWEELNQEGQMQISVYDEEFEYDVEYHHSIVVKSLQEYLAEHDNQVRKKVCEDIITQVESLKTNIFNRYKEYSVVSEFDSNRLRCYDEILEILDQIQGE